MNITLEGKTDKGKVIVNQYGKDWNVEVTNGTRIRVKASSMVFWMDSINDKDFKVIG